MIAKNTLPDKENKPSCKEIILMGIISICYLTAMWLLIGLKIEHCILVVIFSTCFFINSKTRRFIYAFSIFIAYGILYDVLRAFPNYTFHPVDIGQIYNFDRNIFGINFNNQNITLYNYFLLQQNTFLDVIAGISYINWIPIPLAFAFYLYRNNKVQFLQFSLTFLLVNIIGFCIYYIHPAAPPWYVGIYGFKFLPDILGNPAGLIRFDQLIHYPIFSTIYSRNSNVFAALPSLHSSYPLIVFYFAIKNKLGKINWFFGLFMIGIWFAAIYTGHHYVTDVLLGISCGFVAIALFQFLTKRTKILTKFLTNYECAI